MIPPRIIPSLLIKNGKLVKTREFSDARYVGDPVNAIRIFNEKNVDELIITDISATIDNREPDYRLIEELAGECFMPLCYGGGIQNLKQASNVFRAGAEKIAINSAALQNPGLIREIADRYGSQSVVVCMDIKRGFFGKYHLYRYATRSLERKISIEQHLKVSLDSGAGEIFLNSVDRDGTLTGLDLDLLSKVAQHIPVPLVLGGGTKSLEDIVKAASSGANAIAVGAFFVFYGPHRAVLITYPTPDAIEKAFQNHART
ncbi:AglZ/HisF2 family acetamidino modification protein [Pigmentiphaga sp. CHJ604]|uniref:AglZ/HisF2 family acetamidino modification protein n=1 Tax=Pigmentiphaga sp. CHJ604 TaxID=3081984 RepID=UPI0030D609DC